MGCHRLQFYAIHHILVPAAKRSMLTIESVHHKFDNTPVLKGIDLCLERGEILCLLGASGSGKSTLLRIVAGLEPLQSGRLLFDEALLAEPGQEPPAESRSFGLVFQDHVLFPHMSVAENIAFGLHDMDESERAQVVANQLAAVNLADFANRYPHTLSGGQQQRIALARALAPEPRLMLLDEPFASVDSTLRRQLREDARRALRAANVPAIVVTHDAQEAMELADRIAIMHEGEIVQLGSAEHVWQAPTNRFIAELFNDTDAIPGTVQDNTIQTAFGAVPWNQPDAQSRRSCDVVIRPTAISLSSAPAEATSSIFVQDIRFLGDQYLLQIQSGGEVLRVASATEPEFKIGEQVVASFDSQGVLVYFAN